MMMILLARVSLAAVKSVLKIASEMVMCITIPISLFTQSNQQSTFIEFNLFHNVHFGIQFKL